MLKAEDNEILTRVGPGTLMGELLRRYWTPACLTAEIPEPGGAPARVRLLGENLVAFRDTTGPDRAGAGELPAPRRVAVLRPQRGRRPPLRLPRLGVRHRRPVRGHAQRAGAVLREGPDARLPGARVRRHRLGLPRAARDHDAVQGLRHRRAGRRRVHGHQAALHLQLGAGDGRQHRHRAHLPPAPVGRHRRHPRRRLRQARLPLQRHVLEILAARPRPPPRTRRHLVRLPLRRHPHHPQRQHPRPHHRLRGALPHHGRQHPVQRRAGDVHPHRRRQLLALLHRAQGPGGTRATSAARTCSPSPRSPPRYRPPPTASCRAGTPRRTTT